MNLSNDDIVQKIVEKVIFSENEVQSCGNIRKANSASRASTKLICKAVKEKRFEVLIKLYNHENRYVQSTTPQFLLPINKKAAIKKIRKINRLHDPYILLDILLAQYKKGEQRIVVDGNSLFIFFCTFTLSSEKMKNTKIAKNRRFIILVYYGKSLF